MDELPLLLHLILLLPLLLWTLTPPSSATDTNSFIYAGCSQPKYTQGSSYEYNVDSLLSSLANAAGFTSYSNFTSSAATHSAPAYGLFQCRVDLSISDCESCVRSSLTQLAALCPSASGAAIQLDGCFARYGNDNFLGLPDTSVLYKKCGSAARNNGGYNSDVLGMRDAALAAMQAAAPQGGTYRAGAAGNVQAVAQCTGDLNMKECSDCMSNAVAQLQNNCGLAVSGDMFLGKCYVRYWSNGVYNSHSNSGDDAGKTLAIIIGLMAGIALIIIFLSFIRRAREGKY